MILFFLTGIAACDSSPKAIDIEQIFLNQKRQQQQKETQERLKKAERPMFVSWENFDDQIKQFDFDCTDCPPSVGQVVVNWIESKVVDNIARQFLYSGNCQGGMISEDLFLTSRHCLPHDLQEKGASCEDRVKIVFPKNSDLSEREIALCDEVVDIAPAITGLEVSDAQPDWTLLKLKKSYPKRVIDSSLDGIKDGQKLYAFIPLRSVENDYFDFETITCEAVQHTLLLSEFNNEKSPITLINCDKDLTQGFSGTLLFDGIGEDAKVVATLSHIWDEGRGLDKIMISRNAIASNLACILTEKNEDLPTECQFEPSQNLQFKQKAMKRVLDRAYTKSLKLFEEWIEKSDKSIQWMKINPSDIPNLPELYSNAFQTLHSSKNDFISLETRGLWSLTIIPYFAQCSKSKEQKDLQLPAIHAQIITTDKGRLVPHISLRENPGKLHYNDGEGRYVLMLTGESTSPNMAQNALFHGYFVHQSYLPPCE